MVVDFIIRKANDTKELKVLRTFIYSQPFWYPRYDVWVDKICIPEIENGWKTAIMAFCNGYVVGDAIYQQHKELPRTREFKNLRIHPKLRRRDLGHFLLRQVEEEEKETFDRILVDVNTKRKETIAFFQWCGYKILYQDFLYDNQNLDVIMIKEFNKTKDLFLQDYSLNISKKQKL